MTTGTVTEKAIYKTFRAEVKEVDAEAGVVNTLIPMSTASRDRDNEIIDPHAFKKSLAQFMKRPVLLASHNYMDLRSQIGEFKKLKVNDDGLMADGLQYYIGQGNDQADWGFNLASKGMAAFSVGFIPQKWEKIDEENESEWGNRKYTEVELLEISQVVVPSNRDAIQGVRSKAANDPVALALLDDMEKDLPAETVTKPEETENYIRIPVKGEEGKHDGHRIRTIDIDQDKGIKALYCGECKVVTTYLFSKDDKYNWTMASAQDWVDEHSKAVDDILASTKNEPEALDIERLLPGLEPPAEEHAASEVTQEQLQDEIDYVHKGIMQVGMNLDTEIVALDMASEIIMRATGSDIPDDILTKVGAVLNAKNKERLNSIKRLAQEVLDSSGTAEEDGKQVEPPEPEPDPVELAKQRAQDVAEVASLVVNQLKGKRIK